MAVVEVYGLVELFIVGLVGWLACQILLQSHLELKFLF